jgi:Protein of unknown function (DUF1861)
METLINVATAGVQIRVGTSERQARRCSELLADFRPAAEGQAMLTRFEGVGDRDVYNITAPFNFDGEQLIAGRVEQRSNEISEIVFFHRTGEVWTPRFTSPQFAHLQDPCITIVDGELILGGVRYPVMMPDGSAVWTMEFFRGSSLATLKRFLIGPAKMKDIRFCELDDGRIGVFSRPQGVKGGRGKIGFVIAETLEEVTAQMIQEAPLLQGQFAGGEWGGANEAHRLSDGRLGVLGHVAFWDREGSRHYYPMAFTIDPETMQTTPLQIIARRSMFPSTPAKRHDLEDVVFSGGLVRHGNGKATLYAGLGDAAAGSLAMPDPFAKLEGDTPGTLEPKAA